MDKTFQPQQVESTIKQAQSELGHKVEQMIPVNLQVLREQMHNQPSSSSSNSSSSLSAQTGSSPVLNPSTMNSSLSTTNITSSGSIISSGQRQSQNNNQKISFHLKSSIFTRQVTIDADKMALGLIKQLAIAFLNEIYFDQNYPPHTFIGDYIRKKRLNDAENLRLLYERIVLRKYLPEQDKFVQFYSVSDIEQDSYISIEVSERQTTNQQQSHSSIKTSTNPSPLVNSAQSSTANSVTHSSSGISCGTNNLSGLATSTCSQLRITHDFHSQTYLIPTLCSCCSSYIKGLIKQGFQCYNCRKNFCPKCKTRAEATSETCLSFSQIPSGTTTSSSSTNQAPTGNQPPQTPTIVNCGVDGDSSQSANESANTLAATGGDKLDPNNHANMSKRKSASNLLHFNIGNPFKSHHNNTSQQSGDKPTSKSMRGSAGALDPVLQQLSKQMRPSMEHPQQQQSQGQLHGRSDTIQESSGTKLLNVQTAQLSSSHQNLFTTNDHEHTGGNESGCSSVHQSPSKPSVHQLSNSARTSAHDLMHTSSPTRRDQASYHTFVQLESNNPQFKTNSCGVCNKPLAQAFKQQQQQQASICKTCKLRVHHHCKDLALADCLSRITESSRAAAEKESSNNHDSNKTNLKNTSSNVSRDNIRLHRLAPSVKHVKKPDSSKPIIEGWLEHKTLSDEQPRKHYWRLDETDITLYENDTSARYFKAISLNKITRVISASSLPKRIKEDVALSSPKHDKNQSKSANASPAKNDQLKAQMKAMFAFEVATGSVYLVQANDETEASRWKGSLAEVTAKRALEAQPNEEKKGNDGAQLTGSPVGESAKNITDSGKKDMVSEEQSAVSEVPSDNKSPNQQADSAMAKNVQPQMATATDQQSADKQRHHHHHHHHHHHAPTVYRGQHKTYTDPNRSRLYNRPRIVIQIDPMSIPDHWIEGKYLMERDRTKGVGFEELGSGQFGKVYAAISDIKAVDAAKGLWSGIPVAIKEISKARFDLRQQAKLKNEANILSRLDHPGVIILERVHDLPDKLYIVMEQLEDDMLEMIVSTEEKRLSERVTKFLTYQILEALKYLHSQNIAHCDLKPENVLLVERRSQFPQIKLCDFGFAKIIEDNSFRSSLVGTPAYLAPEVVKGERYNRSVDLWSVGVIVYVSLSGEFPFNEGENIHDQISRANFMYPDQPWAKISTQAKNFINSLLRVNSDKRLSANRAQLDDWIQVSFHDCGTINHLLVSKETRDHTCSYYHMHVHTNHPSKIVNTNNLQDYQLWCDLCELEVRVGRRWVTDDADYGRWQNYALKHNLQVPRSARLLHEQQMNGD